MGNWLGGGNARGEIVEDDGEEEEVVEGRWRMD